MNAEFKRFLVCHSRQCAISNLALCSCKFVVVVCAVTYAPPLQDQKPSKHVERLPVLNVERLTMLIDESLMLNIREGFHSPSVPPRLLLPPHSNYFDADDVLYFPTV